MRVEQWGKWRILLILRKWKFSCFVSFPNPWKGKGEACSLRTNTDFSASTPSPSSWNTRDWFFSRQYWNSSFSMGGFFCGFVLFHFKLFFDNSVMDWKEYILRFRFWWNKYLIFYCLIKQYKLWAGSQIPS